MELHMPKGMMFAMGFISMMLAAGVPQKVLFWGSTTNADGAAPKLHISCAPLHTSIPIAICLLCSRVYTSKMFLGSLLISLWMAEISAQKRRRVAWSSVMTVL